MNYMKWTFEFAKLKDADSVFISKKRRIGMKKIIVSFLLVAAQLSEDLDKALQSAQGPAVCRLQEECIDKHKGMPGKLAEVKEIKG